MALLIAAGSVLSYLVNRDTARIALASGLAFGATEPLDPFGGRRDPRMFEAGLSAGDASDVLVAHAGRFADRP